VSDSESTTDDSGISERDLSSERVRCISELTEDEFRAELDYALAHPLSQADALEARELRQRLEQVGYYKKGSSLTGCSDEMKEL
jgi:hypothetical protein